VDVVVPVLDGGDGLVQCLSALGRQTVEHRVIVADNGSTDGSKEAALTAGAILVEEPVRSSYAARNRALDVVSAPVVAFTDADCIPHEDWLECGLATMEQTGADLVAGRVIMTAGTSAASRQDSFTYLNQELQVAHGMAATANLLVRTRVFDQVGRFRAELRSGGDSELVARCVAAGLQLVYAAEAVVEHPPRETVRAVVKKAWRIGTGHGRLAATEAGQRHWLSYRHAIPSHAVRHSGDRGLVAVDVVVKVAAQVARWSAYARERTARRSLNR
jgi:glycosyltransferase involved in cell wall biosynthesis